MHEKLAVRFTASKNIKLFVQSKEKSSQTNNLRWLGSFWGLSDSIYRENIVNVESEGKVLSHGEMAAPNMAANPTGRKSIPPLRNQLVLPFITPTNKPINRTKINNVTDREHRMTLIKKRDGQGAPKDLD